MFGIYITEFYLQFSAVNTDLKIKKAAEEKESNCRFEKEKTSCDGTIKNKPK